jgi:hypothetical protein
MDTSKSADTPPKRRSATKAAKARSPRSAHRLKPMEALKSGPTISVRVRRLPAPPHDAPTHRFHVGDWVHIAADPTALARVGGLYRILATLPAQADGRLQYRVRSEAERFERIVKEDEMTAAAGS